MGSIRLLLAAAVVAHHAGVPFFDGGLAVQLFFIISGFYMSLVLTRRYDSISLFYSNRLLRLFPAYLIVLVVSALSTFAMGGNVYISADNMTKIPNAETFILLGTSQILIVGQDVISWFGVAADGSLTFSRGEERVIDAWRLLLVPQAWSISLELMFYAIAPFLVRCNTMVLVGIALASLALRPIGAALDIPYFILPRRFFPAELCLFLIGILAHRALPLIPARLSQFRWPVLVLFVTFIALHAQLLDASSLSWGLTYIATAFSLPLLFQGFGKARADRQIGDLSYSVYLTHVLVISVVNYYEVEWHLVVIFLGTLLTAFALHRLVENPLALVRQARVRHASTANRALPLNSMQ